MLYISGFLWNYFLNSSGGYKGGLAKRNLPMAVSDVFQMTWLVWHGFREMDKEIGGLSIGGLRFANPPYMGSMKSKMDLKIGVSIYTIDEENICTNGKILIKTFLQ